MIEGIAEKESIRRLRKERTLKAVTAYLTCCTTLLIQLLRAIRPTWKRLCSTR